MNQQKIINDPVYGFITINNPLFFDILAHPFYQRLRRIHQMAMAYLVYPGAVHTRLHHSLGAYHLMCIAINELRAKNIEITLDEEVAAKAAILLHDCGHGPFSHALEQELMQGVHHEDLSLMIMKKMNVEFGGKLNLAIEIFTNTYHKKFLHQLVSGQLDVDRMDYLSRDSYFTGVSEGVIGYDRILKMLTVCNGELMVEEKGIYSIEKFLIARRLMYWQVYLHKTVLCAEKMLINVMKRARTLSQNGDNSLKTMGGTDYFLYEFNGIVNDDTLTKFCQIDDTDFTFAIKLWSKNNDFVLSTLCKMLLNRNLLKIKVQSTAFDNNLLPNLINNISSKFNISNNEASYFAFGGQMVNTIYKTGDEKINILFKDGTVKDITQIDSPLIHQNITAPVKKFYICYLEN
jgi:uncharacterized protein